MQQIWSERMIAKGREEGMVRGREEGMARGREEGMARGRMEGALNLLVSQIEHRFGEVSPGIRQHLAKTATPQSLEILARRLIDARSLEDLGLGQAAGEPPAP